PDAIDDGLGTPCLNDFAYRLEVLCIDTADTVRVRKQAKAFVDVDRAPQRDAHVVLRLPALEQLMAEHPIATKNQNSHQRVSTSSINHDVTRRTSVSRSKCSTAYARPRCPIATRETSSIR